MRINAYIYVILWTFCIIFSLIAIFWPSFHIDPIILIQSSLETMPFLYFELDDINKIIGDRLLFGPFFTWPGRRIHHESEDEDDEILANPQNIYKIYGQYFYYERYKTYEELLNDGNIIKNLENCPEGLRSCGIIDTLNQTLCLPTNLKCPLNDIEIISKDSSIADKYRQEGYSYEYGSNNMMIFYTFSQTSKPIIGRILLNDELPCANPTQRSWRKSISYENSNSQYCTDDYKGSFHDNTYTQFAEITYDVLYQENLLAEDYNQFNKALLRTRKSYLFKNTFIGIDKDCLKNSNIKNIPNTKNIIDLFKFIRVYSYSCSAMNFIFIFIYIINDLCLKNFKAEKVSNWFLIPERIFMMFGSVLFIFNLYSFIYLSLRTPIFNCSDDIINDQVAKLSRQILGMKIATLGYDITVFIFFIIAIVRTCYNKKYKRNIFNVCFGIEEKIINEDINQTPYGNENKEEFTETLYSNI